jgi:hypothetical protein
LPAGAAAVASVVAEPLPELAAVPWRPRVDDRALDRRDRLWTLTTVAHVVPFVAVAIGLVFLNVLALPVSLIALAKAWIIPELYAQRGANVVRPRRREGPGETTDPTASRATATAAASADPTASRPTSTAAASADLTASRAPSTAAASADLTASRAPSTAAASADRRALGLLGDLVGHAAREVLLSTGLVVERGRLGVWLVGEAGTLLVRPGGRRALCWCVRVADADLPPADRVAHLLLALREDEAGFATVANLAFSGAPWRVRRRLDRRQRAALAAALALAREAAPARA